jgi:Arabinose efflux permease
MDQPHLKRYRIFLLLVAGLGGLLYGVDVGIIAGALPFLEATSGLTANQLSWVVAAVLLGSVISTLFAGMLADWMGRKPMMIVSGACFIASIPIIALADGVAALVAGRLLQGASAGFIGVVVPLYLAESLAPSDRGKGTGIFQWLLTLGLVAAAVVGLYFTQRITRMEGVDAATLFAFKDAAWRGIFWASLPPGVAFALGSFFVTESPRWLFRRGRIDAARAALRRSLPEAETESELAEMQAVLEAGRAGENPSRSWKSLLQRKYVLPFLLACVILACNQTTGINSIIAYNATILIQAGLTARHALVCYVLFTTVNFLLTVVGVVLVDRKGRKFLLCLGTGGIIISMLGAGLLFQQAEKSQVDRAEVFQRMVAPDQTLSYRFDQAFADELLGDPSIEGRNTSLIVVYSYGPFRAATAAIRSGDDTPPVTITRESCVPANPVIGFFSNPFASVEEAAGAPLRIEHALLTPLPDAVNGWKVAACLFLFIAFYAVGPGVCVWLALSELMPTRIRSNGMSCALLLNQAVSTFIAAIFLPTVAQHGYACAFYAFAGATVVYFLVAWRFLPETKGKTLEEIEAFFASGAPRRKGR